MFDTHLPGFGLRVSAGGHKAWILFYRVGKRQRRYTIGTVSMLPKVDDARDRARELLRDVSRGIDPADAVDQVPAAAPVTVRALAADFIERHAKPRNRSWRTTERILAIHVLPAWGGRPAVAIARRDVRALLDDLVARDHPVLANRVLAAVRKMFHWALEREILSIAPTLGVRAPGKETQRERVLDDTELAAVWRAAERLGGAAGAFVRLLVLTGQRRDEVAKVRWVDLDLEKRVWTLPREATKADRTHEVPLSPLAVEALMGLAREGEFVLSTTDGRLPISGYSKIKVRVDALAAAEHGTTLAGWRFHDLRRTAGTGLARLGVATSTISRVLNHQEGGVTRIYNRYGYLDEKRHALDAWARHVESLVRPGDGNVVELRRVS
jgi:integrase